MNKVQISKNDETFEKIENKSKNKLQKYSRKYCKNDEQCEKIEKKRKHIQTDSRKYKNIEKMKFVVRCFNPFISLNIVDLLKR